MRETMLVFHFIGLAMGLGTGFAHAFLGSVTPKMSPEESLKFRMNSLVISKMGNIGIVLLLISGFYLISPYWKVLSTMPLLMTKLALVAVLVTLIVLINVSARKARNGNAEQELSKMKAMGKFTLPIALAIVALAVAVFR